MGARLLKLDVAEMTLPKLALYREAFFRETLGASVLKLGGQDCAWQASPRVVLENSQLLSLDADAICPLNTSGDLALQLPFLSNLERTYRLLAVARLSGQEHVGGADPQHPGLSFSYAAEPTGLVRFVRLGLEHIGVFPNQWADETGWRVALGIDHILFVFALILSGGTLFALFQTVTGFTIGHTLSLGLVAFGALQVRGRWVEAAIPLTIAFVSAGVLFRREIEHRFRVAVGIGLVHGLGFATALSGLALRREQLVSAVLGFNLGVEVGQAAIILLFFPVFYGLRRTAVGRRYFIPALGGGIFCVSVFWFVQRAFL